MKYFKFVILGSNSFAATAFIERLLMDGVNAIGISRSNQNASIFNQKEVWDKVSSNYRFIKADLNIDYDLIIKVVDEFKPEIIVDFAGQGMVAESWDNPEQWYTTNLVSKVKLHNHLQKCKWLKRYIRISTPEVYGSQDNLITESFQYNPTTPYAVSHAAIDMSLMAYFKQYEFPVILGRFANFYGPGQQLYRIIPRTIISVLLGKKLQLHGGGNSVRSFIHGSDVADAIMKMVDKGEVGEAYHFSAKSFVTIKYVVETICSQMGAKYENIIEVVPDRKGKDHAYLMDSSKSRRNLAWEDNISLESGISETIMWIQRSINEIKKLPIEYIHKQ